VLRCDRSNRIRPGVGHGRNSRSVSARTAIGPALLLLGEFGVSRLAFHSTKLVGLWALTTAVMSRTKQVWYGEHGR